MRPHRADPATGDDDDPVGDAVDLGEQVGRQQHGATTVGMLTQQGAHPDDALGVDSVPSVVTVKAHVSGLLTKLEFNNRVQIALLVHDAELV
jgi:hypothetical protein